MSSFPTYQMEGAERRKSKSHVYSERKMEKVLEKGKSEDKSVWEKVHKFDFDLLSLKR